MSFLFAAKPESLSSQTKMHQREIRKNIRHIQIEEEKLMKKDKVMQASIRRHVSNSNLVECKTESKTLLRHRMHLKRLGKIRLQLDMMDQQLSQTDNIAHLMRTFDNTSQILQRTNHYMNIMGDVSLSASEMKKQHAQLNQKLEVLDHTLDHIFAIEDEENVSEDMVTGLLHELGIQAQFNLANRPMGPMNPSMLPSVPSVDGGNAANGGGGDTCLEARLENLKKSLG
jgi:hypothetical protein